MIAIVGWVLGFAALAAGLGAVYHIWGTRRDGKVYPPAGRMVDIGSHRLHIVEHGSHTAGPTIVLEAGLMSTVLSWSGLQRELAKSYRVVSYDRAGLGWSDAGPMPRTADRIVDELHRLLERAGIAAPYVLVGHSFGGLTMPVFAARFPEEVAGMVLVDPVAPGEWNPPSENDRKLTGIGAKVCRRAGFLARIGLIRLVAALLTSRAKKVASYLVRLISRGTPANAGTVSSPWFAALPDEEKNMAAVFWVQQKFAVTIASQLENLAGNAERVGQLGCFCEKPVVILSAKSASERRREGHAATAARLPLGEYVVAEKSNHWIMQDEPELVIRAIEKIVKSWQARDARALATVGSAD